MPRAGSNWGKTRVPDKSVGLSGIGVLVVKGPVIAAIALVPQTARRTTAARSKLLSVRFINLIKPRSPVVQAMTIPTNDCKDPHPS
jgi:hypothetical protein